MYLSNADCLEMTGKVIKILLRCIVCTKIAHNAQVNELGCCFMKVFIHHEKPVATKRKGKRKKERNRLN